MKALIEAQRNSDIRARYDEKTLTKNEERSAGDVYPFAYGFIIGTETETGEALDCYLVSDGNVRIGEQVECEAIDAFIFYEGEERDIKIIVKEKNKEAIFGDEDKDRIDLFIKNAFSDHPELKISIGGLEGKEYADRMIAKYKISEE